jgi:hypothetical protein
MRHKKKVDTNFKYAKAPIMHGSLSKKKKKYTHVRMKKRPHRIIDQIRSNY